MLRDLQILEPEPIGIKENMPNSAFLIFITVSWNLIQWVTM